MPPHTTKRRTTTNLKTTTKKKPELTENQTVWKSENQGVKEETFIQTGRRGGDGQPGWEGLTKAVARGQGEVVAGRVGGPTFACG